MKKHPYKERDKMHKVASINRRQIPGPTSTSDGTWSKPHSMYDRKTTVATFHLADSGCGGGGLLLVVANSYLKLLQKTQRGHWYIPS